MDYPYIRVWHKMTGAFQYYVDAQIEQARKDNAPATAIYKDTITGRWRTIDDVKDERTRESVQKRVDKLMEVRA